MSERATITRLKRELARTRGKLTEVELSARARAPLSGDAVTMHDFPYVYYWNRQGRKGQFCKVLVQDGGSPGLFLSAFRLVTTR
jgi:hypothetical protein